MTLRVKTATATLFLLVSIGFINAFGQCPDGSNLSSNGFCFVVYWLDVPIPLPAEITQNAVVFTYQSGAGTVTDPAKYQSGGGGGTCNANQNPFTGTIIVDGMECEYIDGMLNPPLPIELVEFKGVLFNREVRLKWTTAQETTNKGFDVQKSADGRTWSGFIWVDGAGDSYDLINYSATDTNPYPGNSYYRLRQFDYDGAFEYSPVVVVNNDYENEKLKFYPNPANGVLFVEGSEYVAVSIVNMAGVVLSTHRVNNTLAIDISMLTHGVYFIRNSSNGEALKFIKI